MSVYIIGMIMTMLLLLAKKHVHTPKRKISMYILKVIPMLPLILISAFRYQVGQDYNYTYTKLFNNILAGRTQELWGEYGFILLNKVVQIFTQDYVGIFVITSVIFGYFAFSAIYDQSEDPILSSFLMVCAGYYFASMNGVRQMMSAAILLFSLKYVCDKNNKKNTYRFFGCIAISFIFHQSSIIFVLAYFLNKIKYNVKKVLPTIAVIIILVKPISYLLTRVILSTKYAWYLNTFQISDGGLITFLINISILLFASVYFRKNHADKLNVYMNNQLITVVLCAFVNYIPYIGRLMWYFGFSGIILIPNIISNMGKKKDRLFIKALVYIIYIIYFVYTVGVKNSNNVLPYQWVFSR